jgi:hypothetical protein
MNREVIMSKLFLNQRGQLCLALRGAADNPILTTFRHWPHWRDVQIEHDSKTRQCVAVTLITDLTYEPTVRAILKRSFGLTFPDFPHESVLTPAPRIRRHN